MYVEAVNDAASAVPAPGVIVPTANMKTDISVLPFATLLSG
jgi:hypothetical protein